MNIRDMKLFIWDFDGTLLDTYPNLTRYMRSALLDLGHEVSQRDIMEQMLDNIPHAIDYFTEKFKIPQLRERYNAHYTAGAEDRAEVFPGVREALRRIRELGGINLIYTNRGISIFPFLEDVGLAEEFQEIVHSASDAFVWKPAPEPIRYLMEKYGGTLETTVMVGDRVCDLESGWMAGCKTMHLVTPLVPQYPPCDWRIWDYNQLLQMLE